MNIILRKPDADTKLERHIVIGMVTSDSFLKLISPIWKSEYFSTPISSEVTRWCSAHFKKYGKAPGKEISSVFAEWEQTQTDLSFSQSVRTFLKSLSEEPDDGILANPERLRDRAVAYFRKRAIDLACSKARSFAAEGDFDKAEAALTGMKRIEAENVKGINPFTDLAFIRSCYEEEMEPLFTFGGAIGTMLDPQMTRESFVAFLGKEKGGKSFNLLDVAVRAAACGRTVAYFQLGDMSAKQAARRLHVRVSGRNYREKYCGKVLVPCVDCKLNQDNTCGKECRKNTAVLDSLPDWNSAKPEAVLAEAPPDYAPCDVCRESGQDFVGALWFRQIHIKTPLTWRKAYRDGRSYMMMGENDESRFRMSTHPTRTLSVAKMRVILDIWEDEGFVPDVIVADYADITAAEDRKQEFRHQQNETWAAYRALAIERKALVVTATQSDAEGYDAHTLGMKNFSEDKRKLSHVTALFGINQTEAEKRLGVWRCNAIVVREDEFLVTDTVTVLACLKIGQPIVDSYRT